MQTVTLELEDSQLERLRAYAAAGGASVEQLLGDFAAAISFADFKPRLPPVHTLPDADVLRLALEQMSPDANDRLTRLLQSQQAVNLSAAEEQELARLLERSEVGELRKARALREALSRGLIEGPGDQP